MSTKSSLALDRSG